MNTRIVSHVCEFRLSSIYLTPYRERTGFAENTASVVYIADPYIQRKGFAGILINGPLPIRGG